MDTIFPSEIPKNCLGEIISQQKLNQLNQLIDQQDHENSISLLRRNEKCRFLIKQFIIKFNKIFKNNKYKNYNKI